MRGKNADSNSKRQRRNRKNNHICGTGLIHCRGGGDVQILDCDVEEPNANLFLKTEIDKQEAVHSLMPVVDIEKCNGCGKCDDICEFSAIVMIKDKPLIFPEMCHSCGGCMLACITGAITEIKKKSVLLRRDGMKR